MGGQDPSRPRPAASHSTSGLTTPSATGPPFSQPNAPANSRQLRSRVSLAASDPGISTRAVPSDRRRRHGRRLQTALAHLSIGIEPRQSRPYAPHSPIRCPNPLFRWIRANTESQFGLIVKARNTSLAIQTPDCRSKVGKGNPIYQIATVCALQLLGGISHGRA